MYELYHIMPQTNDIRQPQSTQSRAFMSIFIFSTKCTVRTHRVRLGASRLKLPLLYVLQSRGDRSHVHLDAAGPVLHISNFLFGGKMNIFCDIFKQPEHLQQLIIPSTRTI